MLIDYFQCERCFIILPDICLLQKKYSGYLLSLWYNLSCSNVACTSFTQAMKRTAQLLPTDLRPTVHGAI